MTCTGTVVWCVSVSVCVCVCVCVWCGEIEEEREGGMEGEPKFWAHSRPSISPF